MFLLLLPGMSALPASPFLHWFWGCYYLFKLEKVSGKLEACMAWQWVAKAAGRTCGEHLPEHPRNPVSCPACSLLRACLPWSLLQNVQIISKAARDIILHQYVHPIKHDFLLSSLSKMHLHFSSNIWRALGLHKADFLIPTENWYF